MKIKKSKPHPSTNVVPDVENTDGLWIDTCVVYEPGKRLAYAYNRKMESTTAEWVLFWDQDIFACNPNWYTMCLNAIRKVGDTAGFISAKTNRIGPHAQRHTVNPDPNDILYHTQIGKELYAKHGNEITETKQKLSGFFILTNKTAWKAIGGFRHMDRGLSKIDQDYSKRIMAAGYKQYIIQGLYFYHLYKTKWNSSWNW